jgi:hypothetical protein
VLQRGDSDATMVALVVGTHDHVESFLDGHKGYGGPCCLETLLLSIRSPRSSRCSRSPSPLPYAETVCDLHILRSPTIVKFDVVGKVEAHEAGRTPRHQHQKSRKAECHPDCAHHLHY